MRITPAVIRISKNWGDGRLVVIEYAEAGLRAAAYIGGHEQVLKNTLSQERLLGWGKPKAVFTDAREETVDGRTVTRFRFMAETAEDAQRALAVLRDLWPQARGQWGQPAMICPTESK